MAIWAVSTPIVLLPRKLDYFGAACEGHWLFTAHNVELDVKQRRASGMFIDRKQ